MSIQQPSWPTHSCSGHSYSWNIVTWGRSFRGKTVSAQVWRGSSAEVVFLLCTHSHYLDVFGLCMMSVCVIWWGRVVGGVVGGGGLRGCTCDPSQSGIMSSTFDWLSSNDNP